MKSGGAGWDEFIGFLVPANGERILDVGAGDCENAELVARTSGGAEVYGIDPDEKRLARAKSEHSIVKSSVAAAESIPFPDSYFDKAYSTMALHHFADLDRSLAEIARVLKHGGSYVVLEIEPGSLLGRIFRFLEKLFGEGMNITTLAQLVARFESSKEFRVVQSKSLGSRYLVQAARA